MNLAESLSALTKKLDEVKKTTQKLGDVIKKSNTPQLDIENTHTALPIEKKQIHPGVIYDTTLENTLNIMKKVVVFFDIEETNDDEIFMELISS